MENQGISRLRALWNKIEISKFPWNPLDQSSEHCAVLEFKFVQIGSKIDKF